MMINSIFILYLTLVVLIHERSANFHTLNFEKCEKEKKKLRAEGA